MAVERCVRDFFDRIATTVVKAGLLLGSTAIGLGWLSIAARRALLPLAGAAGASLLLGTAAGAVAVGVAVFRQMHHSSKRS